MNALDYAIIGGTVFGAIFGAQRGVLRMATSVASLVGAIYFAAEYHSAAGAIVGRALGPSVGANVIAVMGYAAVFAIVFAGIEMAGNIALRLLHVVHMSWLDRLGGALVGAGVAAALCGLGVLLLTALLPADALLVRDSRLAPHVLAYNQALLDYVPVEVRDAYQVRRETLMRYWMQHTIVPGNWAAPAPTSGETEKWRG